MLIMKKTLFSLTLLLVLASCTKDRGAAPGPGGSSPQPQGPVTLPAMRVIDLHDAQVRYQQTRTVDLNGDGAADLLFKLQLVGDPLLQVDKHQFCVQSGIQRNLLVNEQDETLPYAGSITIALQQAGFEWYEVSQVLLAEKVIGFTDSWWDGIWKNAQHRYLAVQVQQGNDRYMGWVELSIDQASETLTLHRAALNLSPNVAIVTGP